MYLVIHMNPLVATVIYNVNVLCIWLSLLALIVVQFIHLDLVRIIPLFGSTVSLISLVVYIYSIDYLATDPFAARFVAYLLIFTFLMLVWLDSEFAGCFDHVFFLAFICG